MLKEIFVRYVIMKNIIITFHLNGNYTSLNRRKRSIVRRLHFSLFGEIFFFFL